MVPCLLFVCLHYVNVRVEYVDAIFRVLMQEQVGLGNDELRSRLRGIRVSERLSIE